MKYFVSKRLLRIKRAVASALGAKYPRVVFLHIPKCAGSTVNLHFKSNVGSARSGGSIRLNSMNGSAFDEQRLGVARRSHFVSGHFGYRTFEAIHEGAYTFTFLREPLDRLKSFYHFCRSGTDRKGRSEFPYEQANDMEFVEFCLSQDPKIRSFVDNAQARSLAYDYPLEEGETYDPDEQLNKATKHLRAFDYVGLTETASDDLIHLAQATRTSIIDPEAKINRNRSRNDAEQNDEEDELRQALDPVMNLDLKVYQLAQELHGAQASAVEAGD